MNCNVLFFAGAADAVGCKEQTWSMPRGATASELFDTIALEHPQLATLKDCCAVAMNVQICSAETEILDGCTIAFLPPVSGG